MKKIISIVLIVSITGGSIHLDELAKFPVLISHYYEHKKNHPSKSFLKFLYEHYVLNQKSESAKDKERNSQLPFKSLQSINAHMGPAICESQGETNCQNPTSESIFIFFKSRLFTRSADIWLPPKVS